MALRIHTGLGVCLLAMLASPAARGDSVTIFASKDNTLYESTSGSLSNGIGPWTFCGQTGSAGRRRALIEFDIAAQVPARATIDSVVLRMWADRGQGGVRRVDLRRVLREWGEGASDAGPTGGQGAPAQPGDATWVHSFSPAERWTTMGGDFAATASSFANVNQNAFVMWPSTPPLVADVQSWLDSPADNHGWLLITVEGGTRTAKRFASREFTFPDFVPTLTVNYTPIPEPAAACLALLGTLLLRRR